MTIKDRFAEEAGVGVQISHAEKRCRVLRFTDVRQKVFCVRAGGGKAAPAPRNLAKIMNTKCTIQHRKEVGAHIKSRLFCLS